MCADRSRLRARAAASRGLALAAGRRISAAPAPKRRSSSTDTACRSRLRREADTKPLALPARQRAGRPMASNARAVASKAPSTLAMRHRTPPRRCDCRSGRASAVLADNDWRARPTRSTQCCLAARPKPKGSRLPTTLLRARRRRAEPDRSGRGCALRTVAVGWRRVRSCAGNQVAVKRGGSRFWVERLCRPRRWFRCRVRRSSRGSTVPQEKSRQAFP